MGKGEDEQSLQAAAEGTSEGNAAAARRIGRRCRRIVRFRCVVAVVLGFAVVLSAVFWLPPFLRYPYHEGGDRDPLFEAQILASFKLQKPVSMLKANISKLENDIFGEIGVPNSVVAVVSLEPLNGSDWTNVVFGVLPYPENSNISSAGLSLLRSSFMSFVVQQSSLHLTPSFGNQSFFQVLKFPGGITVIPPQSAFLLQKVQILFNFSLNFPIYQVQANFNELTNQMKFGLHLTSHENLYVRLTNVNGTTVAPPTIVQTSVVLAIGNIPPSVPRLKQLAQAITGSHAGNLGLNHTVFGRVKQIRLSSFLQHSINNSGASGSSSSPTPTPLPHPNNRHHHQHHHHQHHHHHHEHHHHHHHHDHNHHDSGTHLASAPAPLVIYPKHRSACPYGQNGSPWKPNHGSNLPPLAAPVASRGDSSSPPPLEGSHAPTHFVPMSSPLPAVIFARDPRKPSMDAKPPDRDPSISPPPSPSSSSVAILTSVRWVLLPLLHLLMQM